MDRGNHDYSFQYNSELVIDPDFSNINRGEVIYYQTPDFSLESNPDFTPSEYSIARVVALQGEMVEIREGQVYIDDKKLDTFYSKALFTGMEEETYFEKADPVNWVNDEY
ncbi:S26 family signal peptidase [Bacillus sp. FSL K6-3431]|uniref:S26 family signal peptidase n=1 Tax=Bacillus sp. FSL K6-3431 TaxID=2921500 RepID=UPI0030F6F0F1